MVDLRSQLMAKLERKVEAITEQAFDAAAETELVGIQYMRERIETATTPTGRRREQEYGGHPGRIETGEMHDDVTGETNRVSHTRIVTTWGWQDPAKYYLAQEHGVPSRKLEGMESLAYSLDAAADDLDGRLRRIT